MLVPLLGYLDKTKKFFQFKRRIQYLTEKNNTQQATGDDAGTLFSTRAGYSIILNPTSQF